MARLKRVVPQNSGHKASTSARRSAAHEEEWNAAKASLACEVPIKLTTLLGAGVSSDAGDTDENEL